MEYSNNILITNEENYNSDCNILFLLKLLS